MEKPCICIEPTDSLTDLIASFDRFEQDIIRLKAIEQAAKEFIRCHEYIPVNITSSIATEHANLAYTELKELCQN